MKISKKLIFHELIYQKSKKLIIFLIKGLSKWNTKNLISLIGLFYGCSLLTSLSDISNWNTQNVIEIDFLFLNVLH